ncbi:ketoacyl-synthetase C-terminal extension domain-containing protein, partial [Streptantibioticus ferralitis]
QGQVRLLTEAVAWPQNGRPRRAGVSSFGVSGTNAHLILEAAPHSERPDGENAGGEPGDALDAATVWVVSGRSAAAVAGQAERLLERVEHDAELDAAGVAWSLLRSRSLFEHRAVIVGTDRGELLAGLAGVAAGEPVANAVEGAGGSGRRVAVLFAGQGAQWLGMGRRLYGESVVFAAAFDE